MNSLPVRSRGCAQGKSRPCTSGGHAARPLAACRAAVFATLIDAPDDEAERKKLEDLIATIVDWDHVKAGNSPQIEQAKVLIKQQFGGRKGGEKPNIRERIFWTRERP